MNIALVPVRCGSQSIPFKNIKDFCGQPLVYWCVKALQNAKSVDVVYVATDCQEIRKVVLGFNLSKVKVYDRESVNANDTASSESVLLEFLEKQTFDKTDKILLVQATSPLVQSHHFDEAIKEYSHKKVDSLLTGVRTKRFFWNESGEPINYDYNTRPRRQDFKGLLMENGAFYINTFENIQRDKNRLSGEVAVYEMPEYTSIEIDEEDDWFMAEYLMKKHILSQKESKKIKLFLSDVDGTLTDAGMYYGNSGEEFKKFNTHDGKGFELLRKKGIKTGIITSENTQIVANRAKKLKIDYVYQGLEHQDKLDVAKQICNKEGITLEEVAYIGDDINCKELLSKVGVAACPANSLSEIKELCSIIILTLDGGNGAVREFIDLLIQKRHIT